MRTSFFLSLIAAGMLFVPSRIAAKAPEVPRDTSFTVWSTNKKVIKKASRSNSHAAGFARRSEGI